MFNLSFRVLRRSAIPAIFGASLLLLAFPVGAVPHADELEIAVRSLAHRAAAISPREKTTALSWENRSSLPNAKSQELKELFVSEFGREELRAAPEASPVTLRVSLEETPTRIVLIAAMKVSNADEVRITDAPRVDGVFAETPADGPRLQKQLIWQQREPILDAAERHGASADRNFLWVLMRDALALYDGQGERWTLRDVARIPGLAAQSRDARGEIRLDPERESEAHITLTGKSCDAGVAEKLALNCQAAPDSWHDGMLLASKCDAATWWLKSDSGDRTVPDRLQLRTPSALKEGPAIAELDMPGPVISISAGDEFRSDLAVVFNLSTGNYEVYRISVACGM